MNYYISDLHIGHTNALAFDARPFKTIEENDETIKNNWNSVVGLDDDVYLLGDISWYGSTKTLEYYSQLNGRIHLIKGNHDMEHPPQNLFKGVYDQLMIIVEGDKEIPEQKVFMHHFPFITWPEQSRGCWMLYGHTHQNDAVNTNWLNKLSSGQLNIGMDNNNYCPFSFQEVKERITKNYIQNA
mgnify:CR=1 FL=1